MKKTKNNKEDIVNTMIRVLNVELLNDGLLGYSLMSLNLANNPNYKTTVISDNEIFIRGKKNTDTFSIKFDPKIEAFDKIIISSTRDEGHVENLITIDYSENDYIVVTEETISKLRNNENIILSMTATKKTSIFCSNALRYSREYTSIINMHCTDIDMSSRLEEIFIDENSFAVKKELYTQDEVNKGDVKYYECSNYDSLPFNTKNNREELQLNDLIPSNKETYEDFIKNLKDRKLLELK